jgi:hypothetical protein
MFAAVPLPLPIRALLAAGLLAFAGGVPLRAQPGPGPDRPGFGVRTDERGRFLVGDETGERFITAQPVAKWAAQPDYLAYLDNAGELHWVDGAGDRALGVVRPERWEALPGMLLYTLREMTTLVQGGAKFRLGFQNRNGLFVGDSVAMFFDVNGALHAFHRGRIRKLEDLTVEPLAAGGNTLVWLDGQRRLWVYWNGRQGAVDDYPPENVVPGCDLVAWEDRFGRLNVFDRGQRHQPEFGFNVDSLYAGWGVVAWIDDRGEFFAWSAGDLPSAEGRTTRLSLEPPRRYGVVDRLVWFVDANGNFYVYVDGQRHMVESWAPGRVAAWHDLLVYEDLDRRLHVFAGGERYPVTERIAPDWMLNGPVLMWSEFGFEAEYRRLPPTE